MESREGKVAKANEAADAALKANRFVGFCLCHHETFTGALRPDHIDALDGTEGGEGSIVEALKV